MQQGKASVGWLESEWPDRYTYCTRQETRLSIILLEIAHPRMETADYAHFSQAFFVKMNMFRLPERAGSDILQVN